MKKSLLLITFLLSVITMPMAAQKKFVKLNSQMTLVKKNNLGGNLLGVPSKAKSDFLTTQVAAIYSPSSASGVTGFENYYLIISDKNNVVYDFNNGTISASNAVVASLDLYAPDGTGIELPAGTFGESGSTYYGTDNSFVQNYNTEGEAGADVAVTGDITVNKTANGVYVVSFADENGNTYSYEGELSFTNIAGGSSTVYPQITTDIETTFKGGIAWYHGNLMDSNTGNMILDLYDGEYDPETGKMNSTGHDMTINLFNRLFGDPKEATLVPGTYTVARNFHKDTFFPGMEIDYNGVTVLMGTYVKRRKSMSGLDSDYDYCYIADGTITITDGEKAGTFDITIDCVTDRGHKVKGTAKGIEFNIIDKSDDKDKDVDSNLTDDVHLNFTRGQQARFYPLGEQNGVQIITVDLGSPSGKDDQEGKGDQDLLRMEFQTTLGSTTIPDGTYKMMDESHIYTNLYAPFQLTRGYFDDQGGRTGTKYEHFRENPDPSTRLWWVVDKYATVYTGTVGVKRLEGDNNYKFTIDLYDGKGFRIYGSYDTTDPTGVESVKTSSDNVFVSFEGDYLLISGAAQGDKVSVFAADGKLLKQASANASVYVGNLNGGVYLVKVGNGKTIKIVKK